MARELEQNHRRGFSKSVHPSQFYKRARDVQTMGRHAVMRENKDILYVLTWNKLPGIWFDSKGKVSDM